MCVWWVGLVRVFVRAGATPTRQMLELRKKMRADHAEIQEELRKSMAEDASLVTGVLSPGGRGGGRGRGGG